MIHSYAINKRTPALLATSQTVSARDRQHRHHSPVAAALSTRVLLCCETTEPPPQRRLRLGCTEERRVTPVSQPLGSALRPVYRPLLGCTKRITLNCLFRATVSADSQPASRYAACSARCTARCSAGQKEERAIALFRATVSADLLRIVRGCRGKYRHPTLV
jgi:hypothetical protein